MESLLSLNTEYLEEMYARYVEDPAQVSPEWRDFFRRLGDGDSNGSAARRGPSFRPASLFNPLPAPAVRGNGLLHVSKRQEAVDALIRNYRARGHMIAQVDPLGRPRPVPPELDPTYYGFAVEDFDHPFSTHHFPGPNEQTLRDILHRLRNTYCGYISAQFMYIDELPVREWLQQRMEDTENRLKLSREEQLRILTRLTDAVIFEQFVRRKYVGAKTFSLEGAESLVPLLDLAIEKAGRQGIKEIVLGMAHRGRLNVLANIIGKSAQEIFHEFEDADPESFLGSGDVKYHLGYHNDWLTATGQKIHLSLCFNPSHLEFVNPVALGLMRAKQDRRADFRHEQGVVMLIHGDAAFAGEGIIQETLNLSQLPAYTTGGTLHVIVNNQIGFTTPPEEARSCIYAADAARMLRIPIFSVNGEDPEAVAQVINLAMDFRRKFHRDVVIDMYCYRRWGHNEGDEPAFTQPLLYKAVERRQSVRDGYLAHLLRLGGVTQVEADEIAQQRQERLEQALSQARRGDILCRVEVLSDVWKGYRGGAERPEDDVPTGVPREKLATLLHRLTELPGGFHLHRKLQGTLQNRRAMAAGERPLDWSAGETLAYASLAVDGYRVRMSGQDSARGTFSHRHAALFDTEDGSQYVPLAHLASDQAPVEIFNSPLSEAGVLGFEYGYSLGYPDGLILWEAQFGDFVNAAQVIIDQFISSAEDKWRHLSGIVLLLPHGYEGQGPEHSSARLERFLQLAAENNLQIVMPSTPAQVFHCLRRQVIRRWQKPLIMFTPKSLLRHPRVVSPLDDFATGRFRRVIPDVQPAAGPWSRVLLCSGKIYYELLDIRQKQQRSDVALVRMEQFYPLPEEQLAKALEPYPAGVPVYWVQEEPENMGAWRYLRLRLTGNILGRYPFFDITRPASASPASGSHSSYELEQKDLHARAFGGE
jgi:2-oxoglutarate dehydrogenase E1 component